MRARLRLLLAAVLLAWALPAAGQDTTQASEGTWLLGGSVGVPGFDEEAIPELLTVGFHATSMRPRSVGLDFALLTFPRCGRRARS